MTNFPDHPSAQSWLELEHEPTLAQSAIGLFCYSPSASINEATSSAKTVLETLHRLYTDTEFKHKFKPSVSGHRLDNSVPVENAWAMEQYADDSKLSIAIDETLGTVPKPKYNYKTSHKLRITATATAHGDSRKMSRVSFTIPGGHKALYCDADVRYGDRIQAVGDAFSEVDFSSYDSDSFNQLLGAMIIERGLLEEGIDPDLDPDLSDMRRQDQNFEIISDSQRQLFYANELDEQIGIAPQARPVGVEEARFLTYLLMSVSGTELPSNEE